MQIIDYHFIKGTENRDGYIAIPELNRDKPSVNQFIKLARLNIKLTRPTAFLYVDGFITSSADSGLSTITSVNTTPSLKSGSAYIAHEWVHTFQNKEWLVKVDVMTGACAAGIQALHEADRLLQEGKVKEVIIIGGERITQSTIQLFKQLRMPIICGDGFVYMRLTNGMDITNINWKFAYNQNPFVFKKESLDFLIPPYPVDYVKLHGTNTDANREAESGLSELGIPIIYKDKIGHTQGISALLETCMVLEDPLISGLVLVTANGLGGYYGAFTLVQ